MQRTMNPIFETMAEEYVSLPKSLFGNMAKDQTVVFRVGPVVQFRDEGLKTGDFLLIDLTLSFLEGAMNLLQNEQDETKFMLSKTEKAGFCCVGRAYYHISPIYSSFQKAQRQSGQ